MVDGSRIDPIIYMWYDLNNRDGLRHFFLAFFNTALFDISKKEKDLGKKFMDHDEQNSFQEAII